jgi:hypothetical protein
MIEDGARLDSGSAAPTAVGETGGLGRAVQKKHRYISHLRHGASTIRRPNSEMGQTLGAWFLHCVALGVGHVYGPRNTIWPVEN